MMYAFDGEDLNKLCETLRRGVEILPHYGMDDIKEAMLRSAELFEIYERVNEQMAEHEAGEDW